MILQTCVSLLKALLARLFCRFLTNDESQQRKFSTLEDAMMWSKS